MYFECIDHYEDDAYQRCEENVDGCGDELFNIQPNLLQLPQSFATTLIFEYLVGKIERVPNSVGIHLCAQPLHDYVYEVILKILCDPRDERHAHGCQ